MIVRVLELEIQAAADAGGRWLTYPSPSLPNNQPASCAQTAWVGHPYFSELQLHPCSCSIIGPVAASPKRLRGGRGVSQLHLVIDRALPLKSTWLWRSRFLVGGIERGATKSMSSVCTQAVGGRRVLKLWPGLGVQSVVEGAAR